MSATDKPLLTIAARQHGVVSTAQALEAGYTAAWLSRAAHSGRLEQVGACVWRFRVFPSTPHTWAQAACLALGPSCLVSHQTAAWLWKLDVDTGSAETHVTVPMGTTVRAGVAAAVHKSRQLTNQDRARIGRLPVTTLARTLVDLATVLSDGTYIGLLDDALVRGLVTPDRIQAVLRRIGPGRPGTRLVRAGLEPWAEPDGIESHAEVLFARWLARHSVPPPVRL